MSTYRRYIAWRRIISGCQEACVVRDTLENLLCACNSRDIMLIVRNSNRMQKQFPVNYLVSYVYHVPRSWWLILCQTRGTFQSRTSKYRLGRIDGANGTAHLKIRHRRVLQEQHLGSNCVPLKATRTLEEINQPPAPVERK